MTRSDARNELGRYLKMQREAKGLTQLEVSKVMGYSSPQFISNWERGEAPPPLDAIRRLTGILKLDKMKVLNLYLAHTEYLIRRALSKAKST